MRISRRAQIAIAIGWFVLLDILLRTSEGSVSYIISSGSTLRGLIYGYRPSDLLFFLGSVGAVLLVLLSLFALVFLWRAWTNIISLTRILVSFFFFQDSTPEGDMNVESSKLQSLFGKDALMSRDSLLGSFLQNLLALWMILLLIAIIGGLMSALSRY